MQTVDVKLTYDEIDDIKLALREAIGQCDEMINEEGIPPIRKHALIWQANRLAKLLEKLNHH
jgi:hypothetical protein